MMESALNALATQRPRELSYALQGSSVASAMLRFSWAQRLRTGIDLFSMRLLAGENTVEQPAEMDAKSMKVHEAIMNKFMKIDV